MRVVILMAGKGRLRAVVEYVHTAYRASALAILFMRRSMEPGCLSELTKTRESLQQRGSTASTPARVQRRAAAPTSMVRPWTLTDTYQPAS